jgi:hypothetical protein
LDGLEKRYAQTLNNTHIIELYIRTWKASQGDLPLTKYYKKMDVLFEELVNL